jgi:hypothetical protein
VQDGPLAAGRLLEIVRDGAGDRLKARELLLQLRREQARLGDEGQREAGPQFVEGRDQSPDQLGAVGGAVLDSVAELIEAVAQDADYLLLALRRERAEVARDLGQRFGQQGKPLEAECPQHTLHLLDSVHADRRAACQCGAGRGPIEGATRAAHVLDQLGPEQGQVVEPRIVA